MNPDEFRAHIGLQPRNRKERRVAEKMNKHNTMEQSAPEEQVNG